MRGAEAGMEGTTMSDEFDRLAQWAVENGIGGSGESAPEAEAPLPETPAAWFAAKFPALAACRT